MTYGKLRTDHFNSLKGPDKRKVNKHRALAEKAHAFGTKLAAKIGAEAVLADKQSFISQIISAILPGVLGAFLPIIGPIIAQLLIAWISKEFLTPKGAGEPSTDELLTRLAAEAP